MCDGGGAPEEVVHKEGWTEPKYGEGTSPASPLVVYLG